MKKTEMRNPNTIHIDQMTAAEMVAAIQKENYNAVAAIDPELPRIAEAIDAIYERMQKGGRLFYIGCGTSGRLGILDASEIPPTYGVDSGMVVGIIAGGDGAIRNAAEGNEDSFESGIRDLAVHDLTDLDTVVGISAAGGAGFVLGAFDYAKQVGALTVAITSNVDCPMIEVADIGIHPDTGAEPITGSTRMKAGSAQKMILNMISTSVMVKLGHVYQNLMINLKPMNIKLRHRMITIVSDITGKSLEESEALLEANDFSIRKAIDA